MLSNTGATPVRLSRNSFRALVRAVSLVFLSKIKVVTENGTVYLLGIVSRAEANRATAVAQEVNGVQKIVRLFEYID